MLRYISRNGIAGSNGSSIFNFLKNLYTYFYNEHISSYLTIKEYNVGSVFPTSLQEFGVICFLDDYVLIQGELESQLFWLIYLMAKDSKYLKYLILICVSSFWELFT